MPGCVCWVSENVPILNDTFSYKNIPILNGTFAQFIPNFDSNIKMELLTYKYLLFPLISYQFGLSSHCFNSVLALLHPFLYNTSQKSYPYGMGQQISHPYWMKSSHSFHSLEAKKGPISFTFRHTHPGIVDTKSPPYKTGSVGVGEWILTPAKRKEGGGGSRKNNSYAEGGGGGHT